MTELTDKQRDIFNFLQRFTNENGYPPTVKEIMVHFNFASPTAVTTHLTALEKKGYVKKTGKRARGSVPIDTFNKGNHNLIKIPLLSNEVKAGLLMDVADESVEETPRCLIRLLIAYFHSLGNENRCGHIQEKI